MYPQLFLRTFWQMQFKPQIFVAMSFDDKYKSRFEDIIAPAIRSIKVDGVSLEPHRVDISKSGNSILTEINDGIAHSQLVLADVSSIGKDSITGYSYRNANVMYEVGLALACRQPTEILLVRDDHDKFLFDVSTIPHMSVDFTNKDLAINSLKEKLEERVKERDYINDARVRLAVASMIKQEVDLVRILGNLPPGEGWTRNKEKEWDPFGVDQSARLMDKQVLHFVSQTKEGHPIYCLTPLGRAIAEVLKNP